MKDHASREPHEDVEPPFPLINAEVIGQTSGDKADALTPTERKNIERRYGLKLFIANKFLESLPAPKIGRHIKF